MSIYICNLLRHAFLFLNLYLQAILCTLFMNILDWSLIIFFQKSIFSLNKSNLKNNTINKKIRLNAKKHR